MEAIRFGMVLGIGTLTALVSQSFGLLIGAAFDIEVCFKFAFFFCNIVIRMYYICEFLLMAHSESKYFRRKIIFELY